MEYNRFGEQIIVKLAVGEKIMASMEALAEKGTIQAATITGIGAVDKVDLAFFHLNTRDYEKHQLEEEFEVLSLTGSLTLNDGKYHPPLHIVLGRSDLSTIGGHLNEAYTSVTMESYATVLNGTMLDGTIERSQDEAVGLRLMDFDK